jgi:2-oxoglutarate ferredoxin oxidoreductase subunit gamma
MNKSLIDESPQTQTSLEIMPVPADELAVELGSSKYANMVALGAYLQRRGHLSIEQTAEALPDVLVGRRREILDANIKALRRGAEFALSSLTAEHGRERHV